MSASLPSPTKVWTAIPELYQDNNLLKNLFFSVGLNLAGYVKAILWAIPIGFLIGLFPLFRGVSQKLIDAMRFIPLTALTLLFITWYGTETVAKVNFLAFGIFIFLLPVVVQRILDVENVYVTTVYTLGATQWQTIRSVFFPAVMSKLIDDIRILTAISWTYIIVAETSAAQGGLGALIFQVQRMGRFDKVYAVLLIIILIGVLQDRIFKYADTLLFPFKYQSEREKKEQIQALETNIAKDLKKYVQMVLSWAIPGFYIALFLDEYFPIFGGLRLLSFYFGDNLWAVNLLILSILAYKLWGIVDQRGSTTATISTTKTNPAS